MQNQIVRSNRAFPLSANVDYQQGLVTGYATD